MASAVLLFAWTGACGRTRVASLSADAEHLTEVSGTMLVAIGDPPDGGQPSVSLTIVEAGGRARPAALATGASLDRFALQQLNGRLVRWLADTGDGRALVLHRLVTVRAP